MDSLRVFADTLAIPIYFIRLDTGENIQEAFKALANDIAQVAD